MEAVGKGDGEGVTGAPDGVEDAGAVAGTDDGLAEKRSSAHGGAISGVRAGSPGDPILVPRGHTSPAQATHRSRFASFEARGAPGIDGAPALEV
jgi:hypothetical protein